MAAMHTSDKGQQNIQDDRSELLGQKYATRDELLQEVRRFYTEKGYALSIIDSKADKYVTLGCDRGGNYRNRRNMPVEKRRKTCSTRLINCPFQIQGKRLEGGLWVLNIKNNAHNHDPSNDMSGHPSARSLTKEEINDIEKMTLAGVQPRHILSSLRQKNPHLRAIGRTIYNLKAKLEKIQLGGRSLIQDLFEEFENASFNFSYLQDDRGYLTHVFFIHPKSVMLARTYSTVFVMDCTYKTNKYGMPLLDIIGMSSFNKSFYSGFAFLKSESTDDYIWALQRFKDSLGLDSQPSVIVTDAQAALISALNVVFPDCTHLLCVWHIQKNVVAKCKRYFDTEEDWDVFSSMWNTVIYAETEEEFDESWLLLQLLYKDQKDVIGYLRDTWILVKEKFVSAWTEKYIHLGNRASSRAEGAHAKLKKYLQVSNGNLRQVKNKICLAIENEFNEIKTQLESERLRRPHRYNVPYLKALLTNVSIFALRKLYEQYEMAKDGTLKPVCSGGFTATMGLPCAHMMIDWEKGSLPLSQVHSHWRIDKLLTYSTCEDGMNFGDDGIKELLDKVYEKYQSWPNFQKREVKKKIYSLLVEEILREPRVQTRKKCKSKKKKGKGPTSTKRDPSEFEIVEATWKGKKKESEAETSHAQLDLNVPPP